MVRNVFLTLFLLFFFSCNNENDDYPIINIVNATEDDNKTIKSIAIAGYDFTGLNIKQGQSQEYELLQGILTSSSPLNVTFFCGDRNWSVSKQNINLENGKTTTITLKHKDCNGGINSGYCRSSCLE